MCLPLILGLSLAHIGALSAALACTLHACVPKICSAVSFADSISSSSPTRLSSAAMGAR